ncbi:hypothetical protein [Apilactobacillus quenuiae]|uniref:hypothetical protein n=1 Tax=Apilactobacillus quenuiae TaxID=2008377 RepID=UPI000D01FB2A|nr:hypothetical protein [Apilactobacillus quenuiae]
MKLTKLLLCIIATLLLGINSLEINAFAFSTGAHVTETTPHEETTTTHEETETTGAEHEDETTNTNTKHNMDDDEMSDNANDDASDKDINQQTKINQNDNKSINNNDKYGKYNEIKKPSDSSADGLPYWYFVSNHHLDNSDSNGYNHNRLRELKRYYNRIKITKNIPNPVENMDALKKQNKIIITLKNVYSNYFKDIYPNIPIVIANSDVGKQFIKDNHLTFDNESMVFNKANGKMIGHVIEPVTTKYQNHIKDEIKQLVQKIKDESDDDDDFGGMFIFLITIIAIIVGLIVQYKNKNTKNQK